MFLHLSDILFTGERVWYRGCVWYRGGVYGIERGCLPGGVCPEGGISADTPTPSPPPMATATVGTHPTGMHSCFLLCLSLGPGPSPVQCV